jgi:hypothetical protein
VLRRRRQGGHSQFEESLRRRRWRDTWRKGGRNGWQKRLFDHSLVFWLFVYELNTLSVWSREDNRQGLFSFVRVNYASGIQGTPRKKFPCPSTPRMDTLTSCTAPSRTPEP